MKNTETYLLHVLFIFKRYLRRTDDLHTDRYLICSSPVITGPDASAQIVEETVVVALRAIVS